MEKNSQDFSVEEAVRIAGSPAGQQLLAMLQQADRTTLQKAMELASSGAYAQAGKTIQDLLSSPKAKNLIKELGGK